MSEQDDVESLSRRLAATDFSADSRVRASLRARLLGKRRAEVFSPARVAVLASALACAALALLLPFRERLRPAGVQRLTARIELPAAARPAPARVARARATAFPRGELGLPVLPGRLIANGRSLERPPISARAIDRLIEIHRGRAIPRKNGSAVLWEIDGTAFILETRRITLDDIFETRAL